MVCETGQFRFSDLVVATKTTLLVACGWKTYIPTDPVEAEFHTYISAPVATSATVLPSQTWVLVGKVRLGTTALMVIVFIAVQVFDVCAPVTVYTEVPL